MNEMKISILVSEMKPQIYFSFITAAISFITLRTIQHEGIESHLNVFPTVYNESACFIDKSHSKELIAFELNQMDQLQFNSKNEMIGLTGFSFVQHGQMYQIDHSSDAKSIACFTQSEDETYVVSNHKLLIYDEEEDSMVLNKSFNINESVYKIAWNENTSRLFALHHDPELIESLTRISTLTVDGDFINSKDEWVFSKSDILNKLHDCNLTEKERQLVTDALNINTVSSKLIASKTTGDLFVVMNDNRLLLRISGKGRLVAIHYLDPHEFIHPLEILNKNTDEFLVLDQLYTGEKYLKSISFTHLKP